MGSVQIIETIKKYLPKKAEITDYLFEGANIVLYSKNTDFVLNNRKIITKIVNKVKKRIEVRSDERLLESPEFTKRKIKDITPENTELGEIWFDEKRSIVIIEADKPGVVIGKKGEVIQKIKETTKWTPLVRRKPALKSDVIQNIRYTLYKNSDYRRKFLNKIGEKIYSDWKRDKKYWIRMSCLGGFREVGRSCMFIHTPESKILIDCGVNIANEENGFPHLEAPEFNPKELDGVIISHAHLDHSGFVPYLFKYGYKGPVYCTEPTRDVMTMLQLDYVDIAQKENKKLIYTSNDIKKAVKHIVCLDYGEVSDIAPDMRLTLFNAGHVLGSSMTHLNIGEGYHNFLYTGDFKFSKTRLLNKAKSRFQRVESCVIESTYGGDKNIQPSLKESENFLVKTIKKTINRGGKVLIPVLGVGRAQEVMIIIEKMIRKNKLKKIPVYVDGMVWDITAIHTAYPEFMNRKIKKLIFRKGINPFLSESFHKPGSNKEREKIVDEEGPCIILATSGMLVGGPSVYYLQKLCDNPKNSLIIVSYQAPGSLGRQIQKGDKRIPFRIKNGKRKMLNIELEIYTVEGFSGHSDLNQLVNFIKYLNPRPKKIIVGHGETSKCINLASTLYKKFHMETISPKNLETIRLR